MAFAPTLEPVLELALVSGTPGGPGRSGPVTDPRGETRLVWEGRR